MKEKSKKIAVLTQPLGKNYGGILQAFALQVVLKNLGHEVLTVDRHYTKRRLYYVQKGYSVFKKAIERLILRKSILIRDWPTEKESDYIYKNNLRFIKENLRLTESIPNQNEMGKLNKYKFDAYVVGSDQVWRPKYSPYIPNFFLDFIPSNDPAKRIAFAASFGVDGLEYTPEQLAICAPLAKKFDAVSVREDSAVALCREHFGIAATHVLDPTLLLEKEDYIKVVEKDNISKSKGTLMSYVLDITPEKEEMIQQIARARNLTEFSVFPEMQFHEVGRKGLEKCVYPPITAWLRGFMDADYIVTDSFHGTAFSIIFNKPFIAIGNASRGLSRFTSLLNIFGLAERLVLSKDQLSLELINKPIDFEKVNSIRAEKKDQAIQFLKDALN
jgi:hypothetical protein